MRDLKSVSLPEFVDPDKQVDLQGLYDRLPASISSAKTEMHGRYEDLDDELAGFEGDIVIEKATAAEKKAFVQEFSNMAGVIEQGGMESQTANNKVADFTQYQNRRLKKVAQ